LIDRLGGASSKEPEALSREAPLSAKLLSEQAFAGIAPDKLLDHHAHVLALGTSAPGAFVNRRMLRGINLERLKLGIYQSAAGIRDQANADQEYVDRLVRLARAIGRGRYLLLAFDKHYNFDGTANSEKTNMYVPNRYVVDLAAHYPELFEAAVSIHPYRRDALAKLEKWADAGVRFVKWLPNAMGMDPAHPAVAPFYKAMKRRRMILLAHGGEEQAVEAAADQRLGNPLRLRSALETGVRVIIAHAASLGECEDLDNSGGRRVKCFDLFLRMMDEPKYTGLLFGDISAMLQFNRMPDPLLALLKHPNLHSRLVNGSDYPLPAINSLIWTRSMARSGFITPAERESLNEIYDYNPLLFDFVLKRTLRHPETKQKLSPSIFMANPALD
jgi:predicted TIM-barrel fold metal-dependent hydrolase